LRLCYHETQKTRGAAVRAARIEHRACPQTGECGHWRRWTRGDARGREGRSMCGKMGRPCPICADMTPETEHLEGRRSGRERARVLRTTPAEELQEIRDWLADVGVGADDWCIAAAKVAHLLAEVERLLAENAALRAGSTVKQSRAETP
jgi:hypothetical protein